MTQPDHVPFDTSRVLRTEEDILNTAQGLEQSEGKKDLRTRLLSLINTIRNGKTVTFNEVRELLKKTSQQ